MCNYKILAHSEDGYVILCHSCGHYQLAYGTTAVTFEPANFTRFCKKVSDVKSNTPCTGFEKQKNISLHIYSDCSMLVLNYKELLQLHSLLSEALFGAEMEILFEELKVIRG